MSPNGGGGSHSNSLDVIGGNHPNSSRSRRKRGTTAGHQRASNMVDQLQHTGRVASAVSALEVPVASVLDLEQPTISTTWPKVEEHQAGQLRGGLKRGGSTISRKWANRKTVALLVGDIDVGKIVMIARRTTLLCLRPRKRKSPRAPVQRAPSTTSWSTTRRRKTVPPKQRAWSTLSSASSCSQRSSAIPSLAMPSNVARTREAT